MYIFYCAGGKFGEVAGVFLAEKHSPDAGAGSTGRWSRASGVVSVAQVCTGRTGVSPVLSVRCEEFLQPSLRTSPGSTGPSGVDLQSVRWCCAGARAQ